MADIKQFLQYLKEQFKESESSLINVLKEEKELHDSTLTKKGIIIHKYTLNYEAINAGALSEISANLENLLKKEAQLQEELYKHSGELDSIEEAYEKFSKKNLHAKLLEKYLKDGLYYCKMMITRIKQLNAILHDGTKLHKKSLPKETEMFFASFENIGSEILKFVRLSEQIIQNIIIFERDAYYPTPKTYGRAMAPREYKETIENKRLSSSKDPTPVFDAPKPVISNIKTLPKDELKDFFSQIGVVGAVRVVFFETRLKPLNYDTPIPQSNGLREYKFPKNIEVAIREVT